VNAVVLQFPDPIGANVRRPIPATMVMFTDAGSWGHVLAGMVAGIIPPPWNLATLAMFGGYELSKLQAGESPARTGGKFIEFGLGLLGAGIFMALGAKL
jgi:hypothetical protein